MDLQFARFGQGFCVSRTVGCPVGFGTGLAVGFRFGIGLGDCFAGGIHVCIAWLVVVGLSSSVEDNLIVLQIIKTIATIINFAIIDKRCFLLPLPSLLSL